VRLLRIYHILGCPRRGIEPLIPVSRFTWLNGVKSGIFPQPIRLTPRTLVWRDSDIERFIQQLGKSPGKTA
jgi:predicted DNA-binding transcriptional regulator AlpA